ncbi:MAG: phosphoribosylanthranilate isomerase [Bacteroidales bacterium]|jgi:phosphoribosylanthranilate isomerase|nr:phosphoribosylanthranilate isomerase [Bacteroidales bacterium]
MKVKVCGMREIRNITEIARLVPDFMGFIFYVGSPRFVEDLHPLALDSTLSPKTKRVGVFVNEPEEQIEETAVKYKLDCIQLHGIEPPDFCVKLRNRYKVIKAFGIENADDLSKTNNYEGTCDHYLFDTKTSGYGGSGLKFDHRFLSMYSGKTTYLLSGGLSVEDAVSLHQIIDERCIGVDINSRFETAPGVKNPELIRKFMETIKKITK